MILASLLLSIAAEAQLFITVDTSSSTYTVTGSDTGNLFATSGLSYVSWRSGDQGGGNVQFHGGVTSSGSLDHFGLFFHQGGGLTIQAGHTGSEPVTLTGTGQPISYFFPPDLAGGIFNKSSLESLIGSTVPLATGSGWSDIQITAVPEPSGYSILAATTLLIFALNWRKKGRQVGRLETALVPGR